MNQDPEDDLVLLRRQLAEARENLRLIQEREAQFVHATDIPLQFVKEERRLRSKIAKLKRRLAVQYAPSPLPHNLPPRREFIGREAEKAQIHEALCSRSRIVSVNGIGGIGKTALALEIAHECLQASRGKRLVGVAAFEGFVWTTANDHDLTLNDILDTLARVLEYPSIAQKPVEEKQSAARKLFRTNPYLLVVDSFEAISDQQAVGDFLLKLPEPSRALITTREQDHVAEAWMIGLEDLKEAEALTLIRSEGKRLGLTAVSHADDKVLLRLYHSTSGTPLAIKWAVGQIGQRGQSLDTVLTALQEARAGFFKGIFDRSWQLLSEDAQRVITMMPLFAAAASRAAIGAVSDVHNSALDEALGQLVSMSLVDATDELETERRRYGIHPLTRSYATARGSEQWPHFVQAAFERMLAYYTQLVAPPQELRMGDPYWDSVIDYAASQRLEPEWPNLRHLIRRALDEGRDAAALDLFLPVVHLLNGWGLGKERLSLSREMCAVARRLGDPCEAWLWIDAIGFMASEQGREVVFEEALEKGRSAARRLNMADALLLADAFEAWEYMYFGKRDILAFQKIESVLEQVDWERALEGGRVHRIVLSRVLGAKSSWRWRQKDFEDAKKWYELELKLRRSVGENVTRPLIRMARVSLELHDISAAESYLEEASINPRPRDLASLSYTRALIAEQKGQTQEALRLAELAIEQHDRFGYEKEAARYKELLSRLRS